MNREQAKNEIRSRAGEYLKPAKKQGTFICPLCNNGTGAEGDGISTKDQTHYKCFKCGFYGDIVDFIGAEKGLDNKGAFEEAYKIFNINIDSPTEPRKTTLEGKPTPTKEKPIQGDFKAYISKAKTDLQNSPEAIAYLQKRGLTEETINHFNLGYDSYKKSVVIPYNTAGNYYIHRSIEGKQYYKPSADKAGQEPIYNLQVLYTDSPAPVFVVESPVCAISIMQAGGQAVAIGGTGYRKLIEQLKQRTSPHTLILSLDNDEAGQSTTNKLKSELDSIKQPYEVINISGEQKDPNEALTTDKEVFILQVKQAINQIQEAVAEAERIKAEAYREKTSVTGHIQDFLNGIKESVDTPATPTGFKELDKILDDGFYSGLYVIGAISSLGKTTFVLQAGDQIAQSGQDVLIFSLEMAKTELMAKSISRITLLECEGKTENAKTTRGILAGKKHQHYNPTEKGLINKAISLYATYTDHLFIYEGMGNIGVMQIRETVETHIKATGNKPIVIIDYLQILAPYDMRATDKQNTDKAIFELKRLSRDFNIPVLAISSLNRESYTSIISLKAFKESGAIEYSSDVLIGLQFEQMGDEDGAREENINQWKRKDTRKIELKILKNRNGQTGDSVLYDYYPKFNYFNETGVKDRGELPTTRITKTTRHK